MGFEATSMALMGTCYSTRTRSGAWRGQVQVGRPRRNRPAEISWTRQPLFLPVAAL